MDNVQNYDNYIIIPQSETYRSYLRVQIHVLIASYSAASFIADKPFISFTNLERVFMNQSPP
jgi:hypothetical protein